MRRTIGLLLLFAAAGGCKSILPSPSLPGEEGRYAVAFEGNDSRTRDELVVVVHDNLVDFAEDEYRKPAIDDAAFVIESHYRRNGHPFARVDYEYRPLPDGTIDVRFLVDEGPHFTLVAVEVPEGLHLASEELAAFFPLEQDALIGTTAADYVEARLEAQADALVTWYRSRGYLDARVEIADTRLDEATGEARVRVEVAEGLRYHLAGVDLEGELVFPREGLEALFEGQIGGPWAPQLGWRLRGLLEEHYTERAHPNARVGLAVHPDPGSGAVRVALRVEPGEEVRIAAVRFVGAPSTRESFLRSRLAVAAGDAYRESAVRESSRRLYRTGLFSLVSLELDPEEPPGPERTLVVTLDELPSIELFFEPGWGSYEGPRFTTGAREKNLFGTGRIGRVRGSISPRSREALVGVTDPWLFGSEVTADLSFTGKHREEPSFTFEELGGALFFARDWTRTFSTRLGYRYRATEVLESSFTDPTQTPEFFSDVDVSSISLIPSVDTRNDIFVPTAGFHTELSLELADNTLGSDIDFLRWRFRHSQYHSLSRRLDLALHARTGVIYPVGGTDAIPIQERFFNGGENSVRSFRESQLGPLDPNLNPIGGEAATVVAAELRQQLSGRFHGALFFDAGNVASDAGDWSAFDDFRYGVGLGLRYVLPIGPIRLDGGWNPSADGQEDDFVAHFSLGLAF